MVSMTKTARQTRWVPTPEEIAARQKQIRAGWTPTERRERAWQAAAQMGALWTMINQKETCTA